MSGPLFAFATFALAALIFFVPRVGFALLAAGACYLTCLAVRDAEVLAAVVMAANAVLLVFFAVNGAHLSRQSAAPRRAPEERDAHS